MKSDVRQYTFTLSLVMAQPQFSIFQPAQQHMDINSRRQIFLVLLLIHSLKEFFSHLLYL